MTISLQIERKLILKEVMRRQADLLAARRQLEAAIYEDEQQAKCTLADEQSKSDAEKELDKAIGESLEKDNEASEEVKRLQKTNATLEQAQENMKKQLNSAELKVKDLELERAELIKVKDQMDLKLKKAEADGSSKEARLNRLMEECEKLKVAAKDANLQERDRVSSDRREADRLTNEVRELEPQRTELVRSWTIKNTFIHVDEDDAPQYAKVRSASEPPCKRDLSTVKDEVNSLTVKSAAHDVDVAKNSDDIRKLERQRAEDDQRQKQATERAGTSEGQQAGAELMALMLGHNDDMPLQDGYGPGVGLEEGAHHEKWDQFQASKDMYGVSTTWHEDIYTTKLDKSQVPADKREKADQIAREIESGNMHAEGSSSHQRQGRRRRRRHANPPEEAFSSRRQRQWRRSSNSWTDYWQWWSY